MMKKFKLLTSISVMSTLGAGVALAATSCTWHPGPKTIYVEMDIGEDAWNGTLEVGKTTVLDWTNNGAVTFDKDEFLDSLKESGIYSVKNLSDPGLNAKWSEDFNSITVEPTAEGTYQMKFEVVLYEPGKPNVPWKKFIITSTYVVIGPEEESDAARILIQDHIDPNSDGRTDWFWYNGELLASPVAYYNMVVTAKFDKALPDADGFDAKNDLEVYMNGTKISEPSVSQHDEKCELRNIDPANEGFEIYVTPTLFDVMEAQRDQNKTFQWTIQSSPTSQFKIKPLTFNFFVRYFYNVNVDDTVIADGSIYGENSRREIALQANGEETWIKLYLKPDEGHETPAFDGNATFTLKKTQGWSDYESVDKSEAEIKWDSTRKC